MTTMSQSQPRPRHSLLSLFDPLSDDETNKENTNAGEASFFQRHIQVPDTIKPTLKTRLIDIGEMTMHEPESNMLTDEEELEDELNSNIRYDDDNDTLTFLEMAKAATPKWSARRATTMTTPRSSPSIRPPLSEIYLTEETTPITRKRSYKRQLGTPASKLSLVGLPVRQHDSPRSTSIPSTPITFLPPAIIISPEELPSDNHLPGNMLGSSVCTLNLPATSDALLIDTPAPVLISPPSPHALANDSLPLPSPSEHRLRPNLLSTTSHHGNNRISIDLQASFNLQLGSSESSFDLLNDKISFLGTNDGLESFLTNLEDDPSFGDNDFKSLELSSSKLKNLISSRNGGCSQMKPSESTDLSSDRTGCQMTLAKQSKKDHSRSDSLSGLELKPDHGLEAIVGVNKVHNALEGNDTIDRSIEGPSVSEMTTTRLGSIMLSTPSSSRATQHPPRPVPALKIVKRSKPPALDSQRRTSLSTSGLVGNKLAPIPTSRGISRLSPPQSPSVMEDNTKWAQRSKTVATSSSITASTVAGPRRVLTKEDHKLEPNKVAKPSSSVGGPRRIIVAAATEGPEKAPMSRTNTKSTLSGLRQPTRYATVGPTSSIPKPVIRPTASKLPAPSAASTTRRFGVLPSSGIGLTTKGTRM